MAISSTFSVLFLSVMTPLSEVHRFIDEAHECSLKVGDLIDILAEPRRSFVPCGPGRRSCAGPREPVFVADDLHVEYRAADWPPEAGPQRVSMTIRHGETIGVAGRSGGGKSTWLRVMVRLTHPSAGRVMLGGLPLEAVSREAIGDLIGYVGQNPFVFSGTIAENIRVRPART